MGEAAVCGAQKRKKPLGRGSLVSQWSGCGARTHRDL